MWKLIRAELDYYKILNFGCLLYFLVIAVVGSIKIVNATGMSVYEAYFGQNLLTLPIFAYIMIIWIILILEIKENRLRKLSVLPISINELGYYRLVFPLIALLMLFILIFLTNIIMRIYIIKFDISVKLSDVTSPILLAFWITTGIVYYIRLFTEWQGRIIFFGLLLMLLFIPIIESQNITQAMIQKVYNDIGNCVMYFSKFFPIIFPFLIHWFFMLRKSYLE